MASTTDLPTLFLRTAWIFQIVLAGPIFVFLGLVTMLNLFETSETMYFFTMYMMTAIIAGAVIMLVLVQRKIQTTPRRLTIYFELSKSILATAFWLWWFLDAVIGPWRRFYYGSVRVQETAVAVILLFLLFYPTLAYALLYLKDSDEGQIRLPETIDEDAVESTV